MKNYMKLVVTGFFLLTALRLSAAVTYDYRGRVEFSYFNPGAVSVDLCGNFNEWQALPMVKDENGFYRIELYLPQGEYRYHFTVNRMFHRTDPENTFLDGKNSVLNIRYGDVLDYRDSLLTTALVISLQPDFINRDFPLFEKALNLLKALKIPVNLTFNGHCIEYMKNESRIKQWLSDEHNIYFIGSAFSRSYLPWLENEALKRQQIHLWKDEFTRIYNQGSTIFAAPWLSLDQDMARILKDEGYKSVLIDKGGDVYPYTVDGQDLIFYPAMHVRDLRGGIFDLSVRDRCDTYRTKAAEDGRFDPFIALYWEICSDTSLEEISRIAEELRYMVHDSTVRFVGLPHYFPRILTRKQKSLFPKHQQNTDFYFSSSYKDLYYRDKFDYFMQYLKINYPGDILQGRKLPFLEKICENWFLKDESSYWEVMKGLNREYCELTLQKPFAAFRNIRGKNFIFLENRHVLCGIDASSGKIVEYFRKKDKKLVYSLNEDDTVEISLDSYVPQGASVMETDGNSILFIRELTKMFEGFVFSQKITLDRDRDGINLEYRILNKSSVSRSAHFRYYGMGCSGAEPNRWIEKFRSTDFTLICPELLFTGSRYFETRAFTLKPGMSEVLKITLEGR